jgi:hypothetical protein
MHAGKRHTLDLRDDLWKSCVAWIEVGSALEGVQSLVHSPEPLERRTPVTRVFTSVNPTTTLLGRDARAHQNANRTHQIGQGGFCGIDDANLHAYPLAQRGLRRMHSSASTRACDQCPL